MTPRSGITQAEIIAWGGAEVFNRGLKMVQADLVREVAYDDDTLEVSGRILQPNGWPMPVKFRLLAEGHIRSQCTCDENRLFSKVCPHCTAIGIALMVQEMDEDQGASSKDQGVSKEENSTLAPSSLLLPPSDFISVPAAPKFVARICGSRASLSVLVKAVYRKDEVEFPILSDQPESRVCLEDPDDPLVRRVRNREAEEEIAKLVQSYGFDAGYTKADPRMYLTDPVKVLNFLGSGIPALRRRHIVCDLEDRLERLYGDFTSLVPLVALRDLPDGHHFEVSYDYGNRALGISDSELQAALNRGDSYILKDGRVTLFDRLGIEAARQIFTDVGGVATEKGAFRVADLYAPYVRESLNAIADTVDFEDDAAPRYRALASTMNREAGTRFEPVALGKLDKVLRPYQREGVYWMHHLAANNLCGLLADEMGLGKTLQTLAWLSLIKGARNPSLIICPTSLVMNWAAEAERFTPWLKVLVLQGPDRARHFAEIDRADLVITSYALIQRDLEAYLGRTYRAVVLDEAQHIKNRNTGNAKAAKELAAEHRLVLTGTPVENSVTDVWSIFNFLMPEYLGDYETFRLDYEEPIRSGGEEGHLAEEKLRHKLHPFILRRLKQTVAKDLPEKIVSVKTCVLPETEQREYLAVLQKERRGAKTKFQMLALLMKLRRIASRGKVEAFLELLEEAMDGGHRVLVFSQFVSQLAELRKALDRLGIRYCYLDGATKDRLGECNRFNRERAIPVFLISLMAGGTGLNLTGADTVIHYDPWWNPAVEDQATDRAHRIGQTKTVYVMKLIAAHTIEEKVLALQRRKQAVINATITTSDEAIANALSLEELAGLLG